MNVKALGQGGLMAALTLGLDQLSKQWVVGNYGLHSRKIAEVTDFFNLVLVWNRGVSFGLFADHPEYMPWVLTAVALGITGILLVWLSRSTHWLPITGLGLVIGGAIGNVIDRLVYGAVIDFLDFHLSGLHWPAFNVADAAIFCGVALLLLESLLQPDKKGEKKDNKVDA